MIRVLRSWFALCLLATCALVPACGDPPNTQYLPIGQRCAEDDACGTSPYSCNQTGYPGGYCERSCATDGDCPTDSVCFALRCRRACIDGSSARCRAAEGY